MFTDQRPRYAPDRVLIVRAGRPIAVDLPVEQYVFHPAGSHTGPIRPELPALELRTAAGSRWYGCDRAYINAELRMVVVGCDLRDEIRQRWPIVPEDCR